jgi:glutamate-1-semialdehyde 2,1-aminomutase
MQTSRSQEWFARALRRIPGGVNSPVRAFLAVGGTPHFIARAQGAYLEDVDGNLFIDYLGSWGPMILGHNSPVVRDALIQTLAMGTSFGAPSPLEVELAELVCQLTGTDQVRLVNSGTEATMSCLRLARAARGRSKILKFRGNYHGHADGLLVQAGSGLAALGSAGSSGSAPSSAGVPEEYAALTLVVEYNDAAALRDLLRAQGDQLAAIIFEPVVGNSGVLLPSADFLGALQEARRLGILLIADEVMTGFRLGLSGACGLLGIEADLFCWGKILGGGLPVGAYGGPADLMSQISPSGPVYQAGTLSGNPLAVAAGLAALRALVADPGLYTRLDRYAAELAAGLTGLAARHGVPAVVHQIGSMLTLFFTGGPVENYAQASASDTARFARWFHALLDQGVYWPPSQFESAFVSAAHGARELERTLAAADRALSGLSG